MAHDDVDHIAAEPRYADWKAPAGDGEHLIWPPPARLLHETLDNGKRLASAHAVRIQNVPLPELRSSLRNWLGHRDDAGPLVATGHQTELYHAGVWVKNALIDPVAERLGGQAYHVAVDTDEPKHLSLRWPGGTLPLTDAPSAASWSGLLDAPSPAHLASLERSVENAALAWDFEPVVGRFLASLKRLTLEEEPKLAPAITNSLHALDWDLGLRHHALLFSPVTWSEPYLVFAYHVLARAGAFAADYNAALASYRHANKIRTPGRPMPDLNASADECEVPFWLDELATGARYRASVVRMGDRWALRSTRAPDDIFLFDAAAADGLEAAGKLLLWLRRNDLRLSPRALTLTMVLRLLVADQFVHGIGGGRYDQVTDALISRHFNLDPPRFAVTTATLYFPNAVGQTRACTSCVMQEGHRLRHGVLGDEKRRLVDAIAAAPRGSAERSSLFFEMHGKLQAAAASRPAELVRWESRRVEEEAREQEERVIFDRELFYAMQPRDRLVAMIERYKAEFAHVG